jgi:hypothetical protein
MVPTPRNEIPSFVAFQWVFHRIYGDAPWVLHRRTQRIVAKYGDNVVYLSKHKYYEIRDIALAIEESCEHV